VLWDPTNTIPRGRFRGLVEAMDIMATVLDLAGVPQPEGSRAWSLARPDYVPRSDVFADGGLYRRPPQEVIPGLRLRSAGPPSAYGPGAMLRTERYKLCVSACDRTELYDLENDPHESVNLADDSSYTRIKAEMYGRLMDRILCKGQAPKHMPTWGSEVKNN
jgi:arylsulfatase A-like enzyme